MEDDGEQAARPLLQTDSQRPQEIGHRGIALGPHGGSHRQSGAAGARFLKENAMRFWNWILRRSREDRELDEELRFHITQETQLRMERGESADAAWRSARRDFGNITLAKEVTRQM